MPVLRGLFGHFMTMLDFIHRHSTKTVYASVSVGFASLDTEPYHAGIEHSTRTLPVVREAALTFRMAIIHFLHMCATFSSVRHFCLLNEPSRM